MPKKRTGVSKRKDGIWMAQASMGNDIMTGKRKRITRYGKTESEAYDKLQQVLVELRTGTYVEQRDMTVGIWFPDWLEKYAKNKVKQSTYINYRGHINQRIVPILGHIKLLDLDVDILQRFINQQYAHGNLKTGGALSEKTIHNLYLMMHEAMGQAVKNELVMKNNLEAVVLPKVRHVEMKVLNKQDNHKLLQAAQKSEERYGLGVLLALKTGMRIGEICGLRWKDVDVWEKVIHIRQTLQRQEVVDHAEGKPKTEIIIGEPKSEKSRRDIPLPESLIPFLKAQKKMQKKDALLAEDAYQKKGYVLMNELGCYIEPRTLQDTFMRLLEEAEIEHVNFHALRHTYATRAVEQGMDIKMLSELLGHADVATTMNRYAHSLDKHKRKMVDMMDQLFQNDWDDDS